MSQVAVEGQTVFIDHLVEWNDSEALNDSFLPLVEGFLLNTNVSDTLLPKFLLRNRQQLVLFDVYPERLASRLLGFILILAQVHHERLGTKLEFKKFMDVLLRQVSSQFRVVVSQTCDSDLLELVGQLQLFVGVNHLEKHRQCDPEDSEPLLTFNQLHVAFQPSANLSAARQADSDVPIFHLVKVLLLLQLCEWLKQQLYSVFLDAMPCVYDVHLQLFAVFYPATREQLEHHEKDTELVVVLYCVLHQIEKN